MKAEEIRKFRADSGAAFDTGKDVIYTFLLAEIAAQLAELNELLKTGAVSLDARVDGCVRTS